MICSLKTAAFDGIEAKRVEVQVSLGAGMPGFVIVGLPDKAINESKERVRAVLTVLGIIASKSIFLINKVLTNFSLRWKMTAASTH